SADEPLADSRPYKERSGRLRTAQNQRRSRPQEAEMGTGLLLASFLLLCGRTMDVQAHSVSRSSSASNLAKLKGLLLQLEEALATEEASDRVQDYDENSSLLEQSPPAASWDTDRARGEEEAPSALDSDSQRNRLIDLLLSTRTKSLSSCFGGRLDRIGSSSTLGCNSKKG
ncbi:hypothetical protein DNTS_015397, partial [Danionella cerebrum]